MKPVSSAEIAEQRTASERSHEIPDDAVAGLEAAAEAEAAAEGKNEEPAFLEDPGQLLKTLAVVVVLIIAIYVLVPKLVGLEDAIARLGQANRWWIGVALVANVGAFGSYVALFRGVVGDHTVRLDWRESYQITMAGLAASRLFSAGGAGGIVLTYWALRKAGMPRKESARRMVTFLVLLYVIYVLAVIVFGVLLRTGVLPGDGPLSVTVIPAAIAGGVLGVVALIALVPGDLERRIDSTTGEGRLGRLAARLATIPATISSGVRSALSFLRGSPRGSIALVGAIGFWASNIAIIWASFKALGVSVPLGEIVMGFFVGMVANLVPSPAGVGAVDGGMIGAFAVFGYPLETVIAAVLIYRLIAFWLPIPPGIVAFFQLRRTVSRWERERGDDAGREVPASSGRASGMSYTS